MRTISRSSRARGFARRHRRSSRGQRLLPRSGRRCCTTGLSDVIGSWKIIAMPPWPASTRCQGWRAASTSNAVKLDLAGAHPRVRACGSRPMMASEVMLLPQPDSPTSPRISPLLDGKGDADETISTAPSAGADGDREIADRTASLIPCAPSIRGSADRAGRAARRRRG